jgi:hypothetical protein
MYKFTKTEYCHTPISMGGGTGVETKVSFSRSPKLAASLQGVIVRTVRGDCECPQLTYIRFERDGMILSEGWID